MTTSQSEPHTVPLSWIVVFLLLALGLAASAILAVGGDPTPGAMPF